MRIASARTLQRTLTLIRTRALIRNANLAVTVIHAPGIIETTRAAKVNVSHLPAMNRDTGAGPVLPKSMIVYAIRGGGVIRVVLGTTLVRRIPPHVGLPPITQAAIHIFVKRNTVSRREILAS